MAEEETKQIPFKEFVKEVWQVCWGAPAKLKRGLLFCLISVGASAAFSALVPVFAGYLMNALKDAVSVQVLTGILIFWSVFYVLFDKLGDFFDMLCDTFSRIVFERYAFLIRLYKIRLALHMPVALASSSFKQKLVASIPKLGNLGADTAYSVVWNSFQQISFLSAFVALMCYTPLFSVGILLISIMQGGCLLWINNRLKKREETFTKEEVNNNTYQQDALENLGNIQMLHTGNKVLTELDQAQEKYFQEFQSYQKKQISLGLIPEFLNFICAGIVIYVSIKLALERQDVGLYVALSGLGANVLRRANLIVHRYKWLHHYGIQYITLNKELSYDEKLLPKYGRKKIKGDGNIELETVCFTYPEEKEPVLKDLSLKIKSGDRVAIIGNSGMGKSTLINVMKHSYEIQGGKVMIDGQDVRTVSEASLCECITYVDQHPTFWSQKNIRENLLMFNPKATEVELYRALNAANLLDEITHKEKGIESSVTALSAGQKQRLAIARALLRQTPIIIMDEPTANLDTHAQTKVLTGIQNLSKVKGHKPTVVFASNVPAEIASANRILLLEKGKIVEDGKPKKLMANPNSKVYKRLKKYAALFKGE
ncbi:MAG: ABC transporter ATP-binding protein [Alphaproteobacteria bacterium]|nr:ABC transporter ATP-binding protein [Alphaproteobacteria bacterium]